MKPTVLVAATSHWFPAARLAMALADAGCVVEGVCPPGHPLRKISSLDHTHNYHGLVPVGSFKKAIESAKPQLIIPSDDPAAHHLHRLYRHELPTGTKGAWICALIERSLGSPASFSVVYERATLMRLAEEIGIRVPRSAAIADLNRLRTWTGEVGYPFVLKADGTSGGEGVRIVRTPEEAEEAYLKLKAPVQLARAAKRALVDYDKTLVWPSLMRRRSIVSGQTFVAGHEATSTVACWEGRVLAALHFEVVNKRHQAGPATVMRLLDHPEMSGAVERIVRRLKLSGVHGFDFMLETSTGNSYLIEMNPRTTQVGHLTLGAGRDLPAALTAAITGCAVRLAPKITDNEIITLFPQEWMRDPRSSHLRSGHHDVPWAEPELFEACVGHARKYHVLAARKNQSLRRAPSGTQCLLAAGQGIGAKNSIARSGDSQYE